MNIETGEIDAELYISQHKEPSDFEHNKKKIHAFVKRVEAKGSKLAIITSGGTIVPLENNTVRYIDNFSGGKRGATSAEYFFEHDYHIIFMHRLYSQTPYYRTYSHSKNSYLDFFDYNENTGKFEISNKKESETFKDRLMKYKKIIQEERMLLVPFLTLSDYLYLLRFVAQTTNELNKKCLFYLAAAVSDFNILPDKLSEHKIQSAESSDLNITLTKVPKFIGPLINHWTKECFLVSFKLETDKSILIKKAKQALITYGHQLVIANMLQTRKKEVWFIENSQRNEHLELTTKEIENEKDIEELIVQKVSQLHTKYMSSNQQ